MIHHTIRPEDQSRRQVQRRFPPGTFIIDSRGTRMALVIGWGPTQSTLRPSVINPDRMVGEARSWIAYVVEDCRILTLPWTSVRDSYNLEEWEKLNDEAGA
jgi:hypothetical protein